jgi:hypothetical protein
LEANGEDQGNPQITQIAQIFQHLICTFLYLNPTVFGAKRQALRPHSCAKANSCALKNLRNLRNLRITRLL